MSFSELVHPAVSRLMPPQLPAHWRVLATGITSIHGWPIFQKLQTLLPPSRLLAVRPPQALVPDGRNVHSQCVTNRPAWEKIKADFAPTHVVHAAGVCDLDVCEQRPEWAWALNVDGARQVAEVFGQEAYILFLSTDLVFSGSQPPAGGYAEEHAPDPIQVAGRTFLAAEQEIRQVPRHAVVRLGLPLGPSLNGEKGAIDFVEHRFKRGLKMTLFHDEWRSCIGCGELAEIAVRLLAREAAGLYHCGGKALSLHEIGLGIIRRGLYPPELLHSLSRHEERKGPPRIGNVALNSGKIRSWLEEHYLPGANSGKL